MGATIGIVSGKLIMNSRKIADKVNIRFEPSPIGMGISMVYQF
jgi:hypothetical protein